MRSAVPASACQIRRSQGRPVNRPAWFKIVIHIGIAWSLGRMPTAGRPRSAKAPASAFLAACARMPAPTCSRGRPAAASRSCRASTTAWLCASLLQLACTTTCGLRRSRPAVKSSHAVTISSAREPPREREPASRPISFSSCGSMATLRHNNSGARQHCSSNNAHRSCCTRPGPASIITVRSSSKSKEQENKSNNNDHAREGALTSGVT